MPNRELTPVILTEHQAEDHSPIQAETEFKFVFAEHTLETAEAMASAVSDCEVIAIEYTGVDSPEERSELTQDLNALTSADITTRQRRDIQRKLRMRRHSRALRAMAEIFTGSGKEIVLVDVDGTAEVIAKYRQTGESLEAALDENQPNGDLRILLEDNIKASAEMAAEREATVAKQLKALEHGHPGARIGVILGGHAYAGLS